MQFTTPTQQEQSAATEVPAPEENESVEQKKPRNQMPLVMLGVSVLLAAILGYFYGWPHYSGAQDLLATLDEKLDEQSTKELTLARIIAENKKPRVLTPEQQAALDLLPNETDLPNLIRELDAISFLSDSSDLDDAYLRTFSIGDTAKSPGPYRTVTINGVFSSTRYSLLDLLRKFESSTKRIYNVKQISLSYANRDESQEIKFFDDPTTNTRYQILLAKRQSFLLTDDENDQLSDLQSQLQTMQASLARKRGRTEVEESRLQSLTSEIATLSGEAQYTLNIATYVDNPVATASAVTPLQTKTTETPAPEEAAKK